MDRPHLGQNIRFIGRKAAAKGSRCSDNTVHVAVSVGNTGKRKMGIRNDPLADPVPLHGQALPPPETQGSRGVFG